MPEELVGGWKLMRELQLDKQRNEGVQDQHWNYDDEDRWLKATGAIQPVNANHEGGKRCFEWQAYEHRVIRHIHEKHAP